MAVKRLKPSQGPNSQQEVTSFVKECGILRKLSHRWAYIFSRQRSLVLSRSVAF